MNNDLYDYMEDYSSHWEQTFNASQLKKDIENNNKCNYFDVENKQNVKESELEKMINKLKKNCEKNGYGISKITNLNGDCFFEVLVHNELAESIPNIRKMVAALFISFKNVTGFFDCFPDDTLEQMFNKFSTNNKTKIITGDYVDYSFDVMCGDLICKGSWNKLPAHLMMMVISKCFNVKFVIINSEIDNVLTIDESKKDDTKEIGLGFLPEFHYIGIAKKKI